MGRKLNIGLVIDDIDNFFSNQAAIGAEQAAKAIDANLFVFPGHYIGKTDSRYADRKYEYQYNAIFDLPTERACRSGRRWRRTPPAASSSGRGLP